MPLWTTEGRAPYGEADTRASLEVQRETARQLRDRLAEAATAVEGLTSQLADLSALPEALLREAFGGTP